MPLSESQKKANTKYREKSIKRIPLDVQKEKYEEIKTSATAAGESVNGYIKKAIDQRMERDSKDSQF
jgi:predicted HicB family RNase H-like nuclease